MENEEKSKSGHSEESGSKKGPSSDGPKQVILKNYFLEMEEENLRYLKNNPNAQDTKFYLFQTIGNKNAIRDLIFNLSNFYDENYIGNKDFIHIPTIKNIMSNVKKYPVLIASNKNIDGTEEIIGTTTIKFDNNITKVNPYFPTKGETVLSITGILTKLNNVDRFGNKIKGIGKELYKSAIRAAYKINDSRKIRLVLEVDCRNIQSFNAVCQAVKDLKIEGLNVDIGITGYYELINRDGDMTEAPTFVLEIYLNSGLKPENVVKEFNYSDCNATNLFNDLNDVIEKNTKELKEYVNKASDTKTVIYHKLESIDALNVTFNIGNTAKGNERVPVGYNVLQYQNSNNQ